MRKLLRTRGFRFFFFFFSNEGFEPPHVHVDAGAGYAKLWLDPVEVVYAEGLNVRQRRQILQITREHREAFLARWYEYFTS